jgi:IPT/TIG domain
VRQRYLCSLSRLAAVFSSVALAAALAGCGGSSGGGGNNPVPEISSLGPDSAVAGSAAFTLTVSGSAFISSSTIDWNGTPLSTSFVSSTELQAQISAADVATAGSASVSVVNPAPGGGASGALLFSILQPNPLPVILSISPNAAPPGGPGFVLTVNGSEFLSSATVDWNGSARSTSFISSTELQAEISAADIATAGSASVTVVNPAPGGGRSNALTFNISDAAVGIIVVNQASNDLVWDPVNQVIYLSVPSTAAAHGNTISVLKPTTGNITSSQFAGSEPDVLAISGDSQFLYAGLDGAASVQRFLLPALTTDVNYSLGADPFFGPYFALDLQVAPGAPHTTAVSRANFDVSPAAEGGITIYDDATPRPTTAPGFGGGGLYDSLQWGANATALYAANNEDTGFDFYTLTVNASGVVLDKDYGGVFSDFGIRIHYDAGTNLVYSDDGHIVNPSDGLPAGTFQASGVMVPDSTLNAAFFLGQTESQFGSTDYTIESFNLTQFTPVNTMVVPGVLGNPLRLIRWGSNGLAFNTNNGQVFIIEGGFVSAIPAVVRSAPFVTEPVQKMWESPRSRPLPNDMQ